MSASRFADRVVIVTGAGSELGMGRAIALAAAREGAHVVAVDIDGAGATRTAREAEACGRRALGLAIDVANPADVSKMVEATVSAFGQIDVLVNVAGIARFEPFFEMGEETWDRVVAINVRGFFLCSRDVARAMIAAGRGGRIVNINSWSDLPQRAIEWRKGLSFSVAQREVYQLTYYVAGRLAQLGGRVHLIGAAHELAALGALVGDHTGRTALVTVGAGDAARADDLRDLLGRVQATGARVIVAGPETDARLIAEGTGVAHMAAELTTAAGVAALLAQIGLIDLLVNAAGSHTGGETVTLADEAWDRAQDYAVKTYFLTCQELGRRWQGGEKPGTIVNVAWWGDPGCDGQAASAGRMRQGGDGGPVYSMTKGAARTLTQVLALELARHQITVNGVGPGATVTNVLSHLPPERAALHRASPDEVPLGRQSTGEDIAGTVLFLASDDAAYITGVTINVDGGLSAAAIDRGLSGGLW